MTRPGNEAGIIEEEEKKRELIEGTLG